MKIDELQVMETRLAQWTRRIRELDELTDKVDPKLRETYRAEIRTLERKRLEAERHLAELRIAEAESYRKEDLQAVIFSAFDDIGRRLDRLISRPRPS